MEFSLDTLIYYITLYGIKLIVSIAIFVIGKKIAAWVVAVIKKLMDKSKLDETLSKFLCNVIYGLLLVLIVLSALSNLGVNTTSFVAILGAAGLAVGLAFKDTFANIGAGVLLIFFRPFKVGDFVNAGGESGSVEEINLFSVIMNTGDNKKIIIPNSSVIGKAITNFSANPTRRVDLVFGISYDDDLKLAKQTLLDIVNSDERILKTPAPFVAVSELAESSVNFVVRVWAKQEDYWGVNFDTIEKVKLAFDEKGISIPFPQMDIRTIK
ncbi:MAG TPA: mechanosensitive ion channel protein MscS [Sulfurospirillum sp. UBA12182]|nr:MAG TPA: mechanosensitive ion channel protein MscS [Sulfurospirillum sp. UBA12182]